MTNPSLRFAKILSDETRQRIMSACCCRWCSVGELVEAIGVSQPTVSHHLAALREANLVNVREQGRQTFYSLDQEAVALCCGQLVADFAPESDTAARLDVSPT
ncbi:MAG TPA: metalloregulator ArsR/SmtB family transcription factor [Anaerolineales bacterium]